MELANSSSLPNQTEASALPCQEVWELTHDLTTLPFVQICFGVFYSFLFVLGIIGNAGIIFSILRARVQVRLVANIFLLNLSVLGILLCLLSIPITPVAAVVKVWPFGYLLCKLVPLFQGMAVLISSSSLVCVAVDRYRNIVGITPEPWKTKHAVGLTVLCWLFALAVNSPNLISYRLLPVPTYCGKFCFPTWRPEVARAYGTAMFFLQFLLPGIIITYCYTQILRKVRRDMVIGAIAGEKQQQEAAARKSRVMTVLILMVVAFLVCWLPLTIDNILQDWDVPYTALFQEEPFFFKTLFHYIAMTTVVWNPLLYFWLSKYRRTNRRSSRIPNSNSNTPNGTRTSMSVMKRSWRKVPKHVEKFGYGTNAADSKHRRQTAPPTTCDAVHVPLLNVKSNNSHTCRSPSNASIAL